MILRLITFCTLLLTVVSCSNAPSSPADHHTTKTDTTYQWTKVLDSGPWKKNYNFQMFNVRDTLWVFHPDGNWYSVNGKDWTKSVLSNAIYNLAFLDYVHFKNAIYGLGHFEGNIEQYTMKSSIYRTDDMKTWKTLATESNLPNRFFYHPFVFNDKIWIIGGEDRTTKYADLWNSDDGVHWVKRGDSLPFGRRIHSKVVELHDTLYLLNNDVWTSTNGLDWQLLSSELVKGQETFGYQAEVYDNKIWLIGCNRNGQFLSQVMYSDNGKDWKDMPAPWTPRGGMATAVFRDKIWMTGGKYGGTPDHTEFVYSNDLWTIGRK